MNFEDLRVGMMVKAIDNNYALTTKSRRWVGTVTKVCGNGTFYAVTESSVSKTEKGQRYDCLRPEHFGPVAGKEKNRYGRRSSKGSPRKRYLSCNLQR